MGNLRDIISQHPAFDERSNLDILAEKYGVCVIFLPKFHCELNPIESVWCFIKNYVRKYTDQTFECMKRLIEEAKVKFGESDLNGKLWRRFWQAINMYKEGVPYAEIITNLYGSRKAEIKQHRQIYNTNLEKFLSF